MTIKIITSILSYDYLTTNLFNEVGKYYLLHVYVSLRKEEKMSSSE